MVRIYTSRLFWSNFAQDESIVFIFPGLLQPGEPVHTFFQWTVDGSNQRKQNFIGSGTIDTLNTPDGSNLPVIKFYTKEYYSFEATLLDAEENSFSFIMSNPRGAKNDPQIATKTISLSRGVGGGSTGRKSTDWEVYDGKFSDDEQSAVNNFIVVALTPDLSYDSGLAVVWQWDRSPTTGKEKELQVNSGKITCFLENKDGVKAESVPEEGSVASDKYQFLLQFPPGGGERRCLTLRVAKGGEDVNGKSGNELTLVGRS